MALNRQNASTEYLDYLLRILEKREKEIYDLKYELEQVISTDDEYLQAADSKIRNLEFQCSELIRALKTTLIFLERT